MVEPAAASAALAVFAGSRIASMRASMARGIANADLRVWAPQGAQVLFVRQVAPTLEELTARRTEVNALTGGYPTGAWSDESRDYHVAVRVPPAPVGSERLAARVELVVNDEVQAKGLVRAVWSADTDLTTRINPAVAHYTGQAELADASSHADGARTPFGELRKPVRGRFVRP